MRTGLILLALMGVAHAQPEDANLVKLRIEAQGVGTLQLADDDPKTPVMLLRVGGLMLALAEAERAAGNKEAATRALSHSIAFHTRLIETFPAFPQLDAGLSGLTRAHLVAGDVKAAQATAKALVTRFPTSPHVPAVWVQLADWHFDKSLMRPAISGYEQVIRKWPKSPLWGYAQYRLGWCQYNLNDGKSALESFVKTIEWATRHGDANLKRQAQMDLVQAYAIGGDPAKAKAFFTRMTPKRVAQLLDSLARLYDLQGQAEKAKVLRAQR
jgi:tetratricopeptide (TPR) repeat protein